MAVTCLSGELTGDRAHEWEAMVHRVWANARHPVQLDLSAVTLLTCPAIHAIVRIAAGARHRGVDLHLLNVPPQADRLLHWSHLGYLVSSRLDDSTEQTEDAPRRGAPSNGPRSWAGLPRTTTTKHGTISSEQLETALLRSAIGDRQLEQALTDLMCGGPALLGWLAAGLVTLRPDKDMRGGGWWAEVSWSDLNDALISGAVRATPAEAHRVRLAVAGSGQVPTAATATATTTTTTTTTT